jgi:hypothetical protein
MLFLVPAAFELRGGVLKSEISLKRQQQRCCCFFKRQQHLKPLKPLRS